MPAPPEIDDRGGLVGRVEVERQLDVEKPSQSESHVGVPGKVEVDLEGVAEGAAPGLEKGQPPAAVEDARHPWGERVGDDQFLEEPQGEQGQPHGQVAVAQAEGPQAGELGHDLVVADDGARDELGKEGDEEGVMDEGVLLGQPLAAVDEIGDLLEGEKRDAQGEEYVSRHPLQATETGQVLHEEVGVFEVADQGEVDGDAGVEPGPASAAAFDQAPPGVVEEDGKKDEEDEGRIPVGIKDQRGDGEQGQGHVGKPPMRGESEEGPRDGKKDEKKNVGVEKHERRSLIGNVRF